MAESGAKRPAGPPEPRLDLQSAEDQFVEIARAEAVLNQRDPEQAARVARAQLVHRDTAGARQQRAAAVHGAAQKGERVRRKKRIRLAVTLVVVAIAAVPVGRFLLQENDRADALLTRLDL